MATKTKADSEQITETETVEGETQEEKQEQTKEKQLAYVGPSFKGVSHCTVFIGDLPSDLIEAQKGCSAFKNLTISLSDYGKAQDELNKKDSVIFVSYKTACEYLKKANQEGGR